MGIFDNIVNTHLEMVNVDPWSASHKGDTFDFLEQHPEVRGGVIEAEKLLLPRFRYPAKGYPYMYREVVDGLDLIEGAHYIPPFMRTRPEATNLFKLIENDIFSQEVGDAFVLLSAALEIGVMASSMALSA